MKNRLLNSFNYAIAGIIYAVKHQKNLRIHFIAAIMVLTACFFYDLTKMELLIIGITITLVISFELINTAIEATIDATINYYHPMAKIAKDTAAGAVLISAINSVFVGYIIFWDKLKPITFTLIKRIKQSSPHGIFIVLIIVSLGAIIIKTIGGKGTPLKGGMPSGHSAVAFSIATIIALLSETPLIIVLSYVLAFIVAQSRVDSEVHSLLEVVIGGLFGGILTLLLFKLFL